MPLFEFFRMARKNLESAKQDQSACSTDQLHLLDDEYAPQGHSSASELKDDNLGNTCYLGNENFEPFSDCILSLPSKIVGIGQNGPANLESSRGESSRSFKIVQTSIPSSRFGGSNIMNTDNISMKLMHCGIGSDFHFPSTNIQKQDLRRANSIATPSMSIGSRKETAKPLDEASRREIIVNNENSLRKTKDAKTITFSGKGVKGVSNGLSESSKRNSRGIDEYEELSKDKINMGSKRGRIAELRNFSEKRRRCRINEKMCALQELIPNCSKVGKASMLDEAITYLKSLQHQVQIMSMGAGLMMLPSEMQRIQASGFPVIRMPAMQGAYFPGPCLQPVSRPTSFQLKGGYSNMDTPVGMNDLISDIEASGSENLKVIQEYETVLNNEQSIGTRKKINQDQTALCMQRGRCFSRRK